MSRPIVIAICGLSGVGKTYLINRFLSANAHATRLSAGAVIAEARNTTDPEFLRQLPVDELDLSQELLIAGLPRAIKDANSSLLLLDAHTVIDNGSDDMYVVANEVFTALRPDGIIHVEADPAAIARQREADRERARPHRTAEILSQQQTLSARRAQEIADALGVWFKRVESGDFHTFEESLKSDRRK
jgi:adenylate kinase